MASAIKPLKQWKKTAWRKKYPTQSLSGGKVTVTKMPVPQGQITSSEIFTTPEVKEEPKVEEAVVEEKPKKK